MDLNALLAGWLAAFLTRLSLAIYSLVVPLAGGREGPLWRWVLVEQGLFVVFLVAAVWWVRLLALNRRLSGLGTAAVFAVGFSLVWNWYGVTAAHAIEMGMRPFFGWEWTFLTWGLPFSVAWTLVPAGGFIPQFGLGIALGTAVLLAAGLGWRLLPNPWGRPTRARRR